jgi:hypothetical protein
MKKIVVYNQRILKHNESTAGVFSIEKNPIGWIVEDIERPVKIPKITGISSGEYPLGICKVLTPLTVKHRANKAYEGWFDFHIQVLNVPNFQGIFFHIGNTSKDTDGCQVGGKTLGFKDNELFSPESAVLMKEFYGEVYPLLEKGWEVKYIITNEY